MKLTVTAVVPCYNGAKFIKATLDSLLNQSIKPDEVILVDDGSIDDTADIAESMGVRVIRHGDNLGLCNARNTAIKASKSEIVLFIDADTTADKDLIASLLEYYRQDDVAGVGGRNIESNIRTVFDLYRKLHISQYAPSEVLNNAPFVAGACCSYRRSVLEEVGGFDVFFTNGEDCDIGFRINRLGKRIVYTPEAKVYHQRTDNSKSLHNLAFRYSCWKVIVCAKHKTGNLATYGLLIKDMISNFCIDTVRVFNLKLLLLDLSIGVTNLKGVRAGYRKAKEMGYLK